MRGLCVGIVLLAKYGGETFLDLGVVPLRPEHRRGIANLDALAGVAFEQVIECRSVGKRSQWADWCVVTLLLVEGSERLLIKGCNVCSCWLGIPNTFDFGLQPIGVGLHAGNQASNSFSFSLHNAFRYRNDR